MSGISTHVLDLSAGRPAAGVRVTLERRQGDGGWTAFPETRTNEDGRVPTLLPEGGSLEGGTYRLRFETGGYFAGRGQETFHPFVEIVFTVADSDEHHHVPLLLSPYGYTTYRGS